MDYDGWGASALLVVAGVGVVLAAAFFFIQNLIDGRRRRNLAERSNPYVSETEKAERWRSRLGRRRR
jgi:NADH:ubiquinone oxidoreductase subunit 3 (subunit A)